MTAPCRLVLMLCVALGLGVVGASTLGCEVLGAPSRVRAGELYAPGQSRFDAYFAQVHDEQTAAAKWSEDRRSTRKPLADALKLAPDASDDALAQATRDHLGGGLLRLEVSGDDAKVVPAADEKSEAHALLSAVEQAARAESGRARKLHDLPAKLEDLAKSDRELEEHIGEDFGKEGGQNPFEVRSEIYASLSVLAEVSSHSGREAKVADDFVASLQRAVSTGSALPVPSPPPPVREQKPRSAPKPPKHEEAPATHVAHTQPPHPKPPRKPADSAEVFQP